MKLIGKHFEVDINIASRTALFDEVRKRFAAGQGFALATINLDHVTKLENSPEFRAAYAAQDLIVADGNPIVWTSKLAGDPLDLIPGSELVLPLAKLAAETGAPVALIGSNDASLAGAAETLNDHAPEINIVLQHAPAYGFDPTGDAARALLAQIDASGAQLVFIALGAPKQEHFAALGRTLAPKAGFASVGAGLDFLSGTQVRAPLWVRKIAMEWLWRLLSNPRRLFWRYAMCFMVLPSLVIRSRKAR
jgi:N-acetylglucosaminyldiphosphoundecaprenol N-acetyl-beta-D-mannosaminyltransferase